MDINQPNQFHELPRDNWLMYSASSVEQTKFVNIRDRVHTKRHLASG